MELIHAYKDYLLLPISPEAETRRLLFYLDEALIDDIALQLDYECPQYTASYDLRPYRGKVLSVQVLPDGPFRDLQQDTPADNPDTPLRPEIHFTPVFGWLNDPNGLHRYTSAVTGETVWRMFYQYNPYGLLWGNMHWASAESLDLLHWEHRGITLFPDESGTMFSGSALVDTENLSGLQQGPEAPILLFYTAAGDTSHRSRGKHYTQNLAYSTDGGKTYTKYSRNPILPWICGENRDPKVIRCPELKACLMALYLEGSDYGLFFSRDLLHWQLLQRLELPGDAECPDFFPLVYDTDTGAYQWVLMGASQKYRVYQWESGAFVPVQEVRQLGWGCCHYAAQSYDNTADRRITVGWNRRLPRQGEPFTGQMSIPMELSLEKRRSEYILKAAPARELLSLEAAAQTLTAPVTLPLPQKAYRISITLDSSVSALSVTLRGQTLTADSLSAALTAGDYMLPCPFSGVLQIIADTASLEIFVPGGEAFLTLPTDKSPEASLLTVRAQPESAPVKLEISEIHL